MAVGVLLPGSPKCRICFGLWPPGGVSGCVRLGKSKAAVAKECCNAFNEDSEAVWEQVCGGE